jgi:protein-L-isoaspartate(D-aspartate) O-methyltransferase
MKGNGELIEHVRKIVASWLPRNDPASRVFSAMLEVDRRDFLPDDVKDLAYFDQAISIGHSQTCSQPSVVAIMLDELCIEPGDKVLEVGSGCGYAAAIASRLCGPSGSVYACEIIPGLVALMRGNLGSRYGNLEIVEGDGSRGFPGLAPFDRIFLSAGVASTRFDRNVLLDQLTSPGILVYPEARGRFFKLIKRGKSITEVAFGSVGFVPLVGENS